ncbi:SDR family NAD(P)-dependent oxidoreductase [Faecalicatena sp. AGMB00832]|uniref:SDR family NAD(P)-dependent oxidoreductase n=1 Tax=Faecalicatena faecalis TaxID=2726362 RepID=A0ABS6D561_9FIRM|nr:MULTISPECIES: SDR family NAD(P)-dependent oxidoreductase [Faecalicatena]MBU3876725.1 SDR family NAD(P)-dependent oxidoreductase [Faecalicatena faecalis]MCI6464423.1 SDR family NAD(P)-dependent oxidoreductase [Faecalicatena sp.]MDY5620161.1 SDR family NAD(P)-dependent oxidoreductase [Lachnospiraceae bacterium]
MKIAIVTGASAGMGREFARQIPYFYKGLDEIWVIARRRERLVSLSGDGVLPYRIFQGDLQKDQVYQDLDQALKEEKPDIRMLVNAAGFGKTGSVKEIAYREPDSQVEMIDLNCRALTRMTLLCLPYIKFGGRIVNLASAAAFCPQPSFAVYAATKSYVLSFSRALGAELKSQRIYVTAVCPGPVDTEFFDVSGRLPNMWKDAVMADPKRVVKRALLDTRKKKEVSVYGPVMKAARLGAKILPHRAVIEFIFHKH